MKLKFQKDNNFFTKKKKKKEKNLLKIMIFFLIIIYILIIFLIIVEWANKRNSTNENNTKKLEPNIAHGRKNNKHDIPQIIRSPPLIKTKKFPESEYEPFLEEKIEKIVELAKDFYENKKDANKYKSINVLIYDI